MPGTVFADGAIVVVKIGSALLVDETGALARDWLGSLADDLAALRARGIRPVIVSSGAIALGKGELGLRGKRLRLEEQQAAAAAGQIRLAQVWKELLHERGMPVAQVLLTPDDTEHRRRYLNARRTLETLLELGAVPVVNENDTVATEEIRYGDNDRLAARVAQMVTADTLVLLSDVDGLYTADPLRDPDAAHVPEVREIDSRIQAMAGESASHWGSGGMRTKLAAARIALAAGCTLWIARGSVRSPLTVLAGGARATRFVPRATPLAARKQWIAGTLAPRGELRLDDGAVEALAGGASLLPVGVTAVSGDFGRGDAVRLASAAGDELGRGLVAYSRGEAERIVGHRSEEIAALLGYPGRAALVHRDDLVWFNDGPGRSGQPAGAGETDIRRAKKA